MILYFIGHDVSLLQHVARSTGHDHVTFILLVATWHSSSMLQDRSSAACRPYRLQEQGVMKRALVKGAMGASSFTGA